MLPTKSVQDTVAVVEEAVSLRIKDYEAHRHHDWDVCRFQSSVINDLELGRAFAVDAMMKQGEVERNA